MPVIVEYKLDPQDKPRSFHPKTVPSFITDGGYWFNPDGSEKMIGVGSEGDVPNTMVVYTLEELKERQLAIHAEHPMKQAPPFDVDEEGELAPRDLSVDEVNAAVEAWWDARS